MKKLVLAIAVLIVGTWAHAQVVFSPGISYNDWERNDGTTTSKIARTTIDLRLGYTLPMGFYFGGMYTIENDTLGSTDVSTDRIGATVGYHNPMGFTALFTYHLVGNSDIGTGELSGGSGMQFDLAWVFPLASSFSLGPQLTYRSIEYSKFTATGSAEVDTDYTDTQIVPYINLWFMF